MKTRTIMTALGLSCALLLAACDREQPAEDGAADAGGRILNRSVTDDMLPYDTVRSRPPAAEITSKPGGSGASGGDAGATGSTTDTTADEPDEANAPDEAAASDDDE